MLLPLPLRRLLRPKRLLRRSAQTAEPDRLFGESALVVSIAAVSEYARGAQQLITSNIKDRGGNPVQCVIADTTIGGVYEAAQCADKFRREGLITGRS